MLKDIITKLKKSGLVGRSGSGFPVWKKWQAVKQAKSDGKYVICNASEGEPKVTKDGYILKKYPKETIEGIKLAMKTVGAQTAYIYINKTYYQKFKKNLSRLINNAPIEFFEKPEGYLAGEETCLLDAIEGKQPPQPRVKPPFPTESGLWGKPTLINNVETFYWVNQINNNKYKHNRFYSINGDVKNKGVFELPENIPIKSILEITNNLPKFKFFAQVGGGACGAILLPDELKQPVQGTASIIIFNKKTTSPLFLMRKWAKFFLKNNCDKCTPCREGIYRIDEILNNTQETISAKDKETLKDIFLAMEKTSLCPLGKIAVNPFKTTIEKLL